VTSSQSKSERPATLSDNPKKVSGLQTKDIASGVDAGETVPPSISAENPPAEIRTSAMDRVASQATAIDYGLIVPGAIFLMMLGAAIYTLRAGRR